jgi:hypothetical protein
MPGMMKQETWGVSQAKEGVCQKSSKSEVERESHSLKCTNSGDPPEKPQFLNQKICLNLPGETSFNFYIGIWETNIS